nr:hypothetical protein [Pseudomonas caspiana]
MKYVLFMVIVVSTLWQLSFANEYWWQTLVLTALSCSWPVATIYFYDFSKAMAGRNSPYMCEFYAELRKELLFFLVSGVVFFSIAFSTSITYSLSNIDIAFFGFPFLLCSMSDIYNLKRLSIAGMRFSKKIIWLLFGLLVVTGAAYIYFLWLIYSNKFSASKSLWIQLTLLFTTFCSFIGAHQIVFVIKKQKMEVSPVLVELFASMRSSSGFYKLTEEMAQQWNANVFQKKQEQRRKKLKKKKRR